MTFFFFLLLELVLKTLYNTYLCYIHNIDVRQEGTLGGSLQVGS